LIRTRSANGRGDSLSQSLSLGIYGGMAAVEEIIECQEFVLLGVRFGNRPRTFEQ
jgi:hypothetical protein